MVDRPDRSTDDARKAADVALARLDELIGGLGDGGAGNGGPAAGAAVATERPPLPQVRVRTPPNGPPTLDPSARALDRRRAAAEAAIREELARRQREIERRRRTFDPDRRARQRSRAAARALPILMRHALAAEPRPADEINPVVRGLAALPLLLAAVLAEELRQEAEAAAAERERRARAAVAGLHTLFSWALGGAPPPPGWVATASLHALFRHALAAAPVPAPDPAVELPVTVEVTLDSPVAPPPAAAAVDALPRLFAFALGGRRAPLRRRWLRSGLVGALAAALVTVGLFATGVLPPERAGDGDAPVSSSLRGGNPAASVVGQAGRPRIDVYRQPGGEVTHTLGHPTATGAPLVFLVTDDATSPEWVEALLPVPPNGSRGWVRRTDLTFGTTEYRVVVRLGERRLELWEGDRQLFAAGVAVGADAAPTPGARFYVTELLRPPDPDTVYGSYAFGLSGSSNTLEKFGTGEGVVAIHGLGDPSQVGGEVDGAFVGMADDDLERLVGVLPLGTPVEITR